MKGYVDQLECLGYMLPQDLIVGLILNGLTKDFAGFVRNYNMHNMGKTIGELHAMLIEYEKGLPKKDETLQVMMIKGGKIQKANKKSLKAKGKGKANGKGKDKQVYIPKPKNPKPSVKEHPAKDDTCHHCMEVGHWKRNYPVYLAELLKKKKQVGCQFFKKARKLKQGALYLYVGNGVRAQVEAIGSYDLVLPNGLVICLDNFSKNNVFYFNVIPSNGIYEIDMHDLVPNVNSIYNVSTKRAKHNLDSTYLWHCCLAHISKKRIEKLQQEGILKSTDDESFDQCVSCLSGKMTRKSFPHRPERATDLLGIIHTDVCGPLRHVSRQGASYFITFTDDYSRYGYVYLLKHKHELTPPYAPQHNRVSERRNRTLLDMVRSMMNLTTLLLSFWDYALKSAARILNMVPTKKVDKTPYELWYGKVPNLSYLKVWGCEAHMKRDTLDKLQQRSVKCIFIGYPKETMGYYFYFPPENKIVVARYAKFFKKNLITQEVSGRAMDLEEIQDENTSPSEITSEIPIEVEGFEPPQEEVILWIDAMNAEIQSMMDNMVWVLVDIPPACKTVRSFVDPNHPRKVCKLQRSIYGLKQASRNWNKRFDEEIKRFSFDQNLDEPCVYQKASGSNITFLILYVDDIIIMGNYISSLQSVNDYLGKCFAIKDLREATFILGIKIYRDRSKRLIGLGQHAYIDKILKRYKMDNSKRGHIPMQERLDLNKTQGASTPKEVKRMQNVPYALAVGSIMYAIRCTRPDVAFAQNITSRFQQNPGESHWTAVKNILKYLRNPKDMFLVYGGNPKVKVRVDCYCNAGFETDIDDMKSLTVYVFVLNGSAVD
ncbi:retrotransposon protein, putative, ty1-copia subclass [Tanacetum coccineum]